MTEPFSRLYEKKFTVEEAHKILGLKESIATFRSKVHRNTYPAYKGAGATLLGEHHLEAILESLDTGVNNTAGEKRKRVKRKPKPAASLDQVIDAELTPDPFRTTSRSQALHRTKEKA